MINIADSWTAGVSATKPAVLCDAAKESVLTSAEYRPTANKNSSQNPVLW